MKPSLMNGLEEDMEDELKSSFIQGKLFRMQLVASLERKIESARKESCKKGFILEGDFSQRMADMIGYERGLREMISLLNEKSVK
jgi:hypothetical protein